MKIKCSTGEVVYSYKDYLKTKHWINKKIQFLKNHKNECSMCGRKNCKLDLHHMTYENVGNEKLDDLVVLCNECHTKVHKNLDKFKDTTILKHLKEIKKKSRKVEGKITTCQKCIHSNRKKGCDLGYDHSFTVAKKCKRYCENDYRISRKDLNKIKEMKKNNEESKNKKEVLTSAQQEARRRAFEKRKRYL